MNLLGILSLLLISSSSVLCRRIRRQDPEIPPESELANLPKLRDEIPERKQDLEAGSWKVDATTTAEDVLQENLAVPDDTEIGGIKLPEYEGRLEIPVSKKRIQKMLQKAIVQIITGDLTTADMLLLKSLNYDAEQVRTIREQEFEKRRNQQETVTEDRKPIRHIDVDNERKHPQKNTDYDYEAYNNQATLDYEYAASNFEANNESWTDSQTEYENSKSNLPNNPLSRGANVVFTIKYNDSEFDSSSEENPKVSGTEDNTQTAINGTGSTFPAVTTAANSTPAPVDDRINTFSELWNMKNYFSTTEDPEEDNDVSSKNIPSKKEDEDSDQLNPESRFRYSVDEPLVAEESRSKVSLSVAALPSNNDKLNATSNATTSQNGTSSTKYKGLKWIQDNVYQVLPEYFDMSFDSMENNTSDSSYENASYQNLDDSVAKDPMTPNDLVDTHGMANDAPAPSGSWISAENLANLTAQRQMATEQRKAGNVSSFSNSQKQKTEDDIKSRVLMITGRLNSTGNNNPLQPRQEKLAMFTPTCGMPRNTDSESWQDSFSMNMHFQLNLSSDQHLVAAKLRLYRLPQENTTTTASTVVDGVENDEKKIRVSVYYYTKSLKKHRSRKCLMDSKVASLTAVGEHLALDVKDAVKRWRSNTRNSNHGLLVLVEDQEGRPLRPSHYIQATDCHTPTDSVQQDEKTNESLRSSLEPVVVTFAS